MARPLLAFFDARLIFLIAFFAFHIRWWTFLILVIARTLFGVAEQLNYSLASLVRLLKSRLTGRCRSAVPYTRPRSMEEYSPGLAMRDEAKPFR
ncbi:IcmT/TraK family protein [Sulfitobacter algicola]|uniref:IcmT/TraK family protein n=1 Tax=Parasulfitobacter algicola TaxID=2614809 RepID=UPI001C2DC5EF